MRRLLGWSILVTLAGACGGDPKSVDPPAVVAPSGRALDPAASLPTASTELTFTAGGREIPGTLVAPTAPGPWPAVLLLAGSGPTDRDWNSKLLPATNGSGKLLAAELAKRGAVVLRFDKAGSGRNAGPPLDQWTVDTYRDEAASALALLRARADVRADRVFVAGHSEGAIHATRLAQVAGDQLAGILYLAPASRSMADTIVTQLENQLKNPLAGLSPADVEREVTSIKKTLADFQAGRMVDPTSASTIPPIQQLIAGIVNPATATLTRGLLFFDNAAEAPKLRQPVFLLGGGKDVQVDPELDVHHLERAVHTPGRDVTSHVAPDADHVLKHEPKTVPELRANLVAVQNGYNADGRALDPDALSAIATWLAAHTR